MKNVAFLILVSISFFLQSCSKDDDIASKEIIKYQIDFNENDGKWPIGQVENGVITSIENGYFNINNSLISSYYFYTIAPNLSGTNTLSAIETRIKASRNNGTGRSGGGLTWGANVPKGIGFNFMMSNYGDFIIFGFPNGNNTDPTVYKDWTVSNAVKKNDFNVMRIELRNGVLYFFINGTQVYSMNYVNENTLSACGVNAGPQSLLLADYFKVVEMK